LTGRLAPFLDYLDKLIKGDFIVGSTFSAADIAIGYVVGVAAKLNLLSNTPNLLKYIGGISSRPAFGRAFAPQESSEVRALKAQLKKLTIENKGLQKQLSSVTVYHHPGTPSTRVIWLLYELGLQQDVDFNIYDLRDKGWKYIQTPEYKLLNPNQTVGALVDGNKHVWENGSIIQYFLKKYPSDLNSKYWTVDQHTKNNLYEYWCLTSLDGKFGTNVLGQTKIPTYIGASAAKWWHEKAEPIILGHLGENKYLQGASFSITDIYLGYTLTLLAHNGVLAKSHKNITAYYHRILNREAFSRAMVGTIYKFE
jgi:glutathione S-transferase